MGRHALPWTVLSVNQDVTEHELSIDLWGRPFGPPTPRHQASQHTPVPIPDNPSDPWLGTCALCGRRLHLYDGTWRHRRRD